MQIINLEVSAIKLRKARGKRRAVEVADAIGISRQHLWLIENGRAKPSADTLVKLCALYGLPIHQVTRKAA